MGLSGLALLNVGYLALGLGTLGLFGSARTWGDLAAKAGLAYLAGACVVGVAAAEFAVVDVPLGAVPVVVVASIVFAVGLRRFARRLEPGKTEREERPWGSRLIGAAALVQTGLLLAVAGTAFAVRPLWEWDGWAIWGFKARALYAFGGVSNPAFESHVYAHHMQDYPLFLPALEATAFRAMGGVDERLVHLQLLGLAVGFVGALWALLRPRVPAELLGLSVLAIVAAPGILDALAANYADIPLAIFVALGLVALTRWLLDPQRQLLVWASLFLACAALTKNEGALFAGAAIVATLVVARRRKPLLAVAGATFLPLVPWRVFVSVHHIHDPALSPGDLRPTVLARHTDRIEPAASRLLHELVFTQHGLLVPMTLIAFVAGFTAGRGRVVLAVATWFAVSFAGLVFVYWGSRLPLDWYLDTSAPRIVLPLVLAGAALAPMLAGEAWRQSLAELRGQKGLYTSTSVPTPMSTAPSNIDGSA
jgi:hypothetical protein